VETTYNPSVNLYTLSPFFFFFLVEQECLFFNKYNMKESKGVSQTFHMANIFSKFFSTGVCG